MRVRSIEKTGMHTGHGTPDWIDIGDDGQIPPEVWPGIIGDKNNFIKQMVKQIVDVGEDRFSANICQGFIFAGKSAAETAGQNDAGTLRGRIQNRVSHVIILPSKTIDLRVRAPIW